MAKANSPFVPLTAAVLTVSDTRTRATDTSGDSIEALLVGAGHRVAQREIVRDDIDALQGHLRRWLSLQEIDVVIVTGGTGLTRRDITPEAAMPFITKPIPGFGELFRMLSYAEVGTSTIQSRTLAGFAGSALLFLLPGSTNACRLALEKIILPQIDASNRPCNLAELLPRMRHEP